ncbi:MrpH family fimbial adhesin [Serratia marcescens]|uniref:MrpH family fimbial adhesin n=1 Tax=Serratia marcescens TaxID=615 RepID=UPI003F51875B
MYSYIESSRGSPTNADYNYVIDSWDENDTTPNPCYGLKICIVGISHRHELNGQGGTYTDSLHSSGVREILTARTVGELGKIYKRYYPLPRRGTQHHGGPAQTQECVGIFYINNSPSGIHPMPGSICGIAPPPVGVCGIEDGAITLEHGTKSLAEINGDTTTGYLRVKCSSVMNVILYVKTEVNGKLYLDANKSLYSTIKVNGNSGDKGYQFYANNSGVSVPITSTLTSNGATGAGVFSGQTIAILALP